MSESKHPLSVLPGVQKIAIVDDAFITLRRSELRTDDADALEQILAREEIKTELAALDIVLTGPDALSDELLNRLSDSSVELDGFIAALYEASSELADRIVEQRLMHKIASSMRAAFQCVVETIRPDETKDLRDYDIVFLDYYLQGAGNAAGVALSEAWAQHLQESSHAQKQQLLVLMSSLGDVRELRKKFRAKVGVNGGAFMFVGKADMNETWQIRAHLGMLAKALPQSAALGKYVNGIKDELKKATHDFFELVESLDISDYSYLQSLSLHADGHPLGDYLSWLFSSHLGALTFERSALRDIQRQVDEVVFQGTLMPPTAPSTMVSELYHSALFARNVGPLADHPRDRTGSGPPMLQLGDIFFTSERSKAIVVLSADCDLAFTPDQDDRVPDRDRSVLFVEGKPVHITSAKEPGVGKSAVRFSDEGQVYQIDWNFRSYRTVPLGDVRSYLLEKRYEITKRERLRFLHAIKLQQEFGAYTLRVGPPVGPPVMRKVTGEIWSTVRGKLDKREASLTLDDIALMTVSRQNFVVLTMAGVVTLRSELQTLERDVRLAMDALPNTPEGLREKGKFGSQSSVLKGKLGDDKYWEELASTPVLISAKGTLSKNGCLRIAWGVEKLSEVESKEAMLVLHVNG